jgi:hypothetical protein
LIKLPFGQVAIWTTCLLVMLPFDQLVVLSTYHLVICQNQF